MERYFAYGSNMSLRRILRRAPCARVVGSFRLEGYSLRFHKVGTDGSGKCDAFATGDDGDRVMGRLFEISREGLGSLDRAEGLGTGYERDVVTVVDSGGTALRAHTYTALPIDPALAPYDWYKHHVWVGGQEAELPGDYLRSIEARPALVDPDLARSARQWELYRRDPSARFRRGATPTVRKGPEDKGPDL